MLDLQRLRVLRTVVATGSVRESAEALGFTPSAVSQQLAVLQRETGLALVRRQGRGLAPTTAGRTLASATGPLLAELTSVETLVADLRAGRSATLSLAYFTSAGGDWVPKVVAVLAREFPDVRLDLKLSELHPRGSARVDMEMLVAPVHGSAPSVDDHAVHHLRDDPYVAVVPASHQLAAREEIALAELAAERWIDNDVPRGPCRKVVLDACARAGFTPTFGLEAPDYAGAMAFAAAGVGITTVPRLALSRLPRGAVAVPLAAPAPTRSIYLCVRAGVEQHPAVRRAIALLRGDEP